MQMQTQANRPTGEVVRDFRFPCAAYTAGWLMQQEDELRTFPMARIVEEMVARRAIPEEDITQVEPCVAAICDELGINRWSALFFRLLNAVLEGARYVGDGNRGHWLAIATPRAPEHVERQWDRLERGYRPHASTPSGYLRYGNRGRQGAHF